MQISTYMTNDETKAMTIYQIMETIYDKYGQTRAENESVNDYFYRNRLYWYYAVKSMGDCMKDISNIPDMQSVIYGKRQEASEAYHSLVAAVAKTTEDHKKKYNELYEKVRVAKIPNTPNYMYNTDNAIRQHIDGALADDKYLIDLIDNHAQYLEDTIKSIDAIIYAISNRIRIEELKIGRQ